MAMVVFFLQVWEGLLCSSQSQIHRSMGRWEILPCKWFITRTPVLSFHLRVFCTCSVLQFERLFHGPYPFCTCGHTHQITVPYQSVWSWLVYGFSLDTMHTCGYIDWEYPKRLYTTSNIWWPSYRRGIHCLKHLVVGCLRCAQGRLGEVVWPGRIRSGFRSGWGDPF